MHHWFEVLISPLTTDLPVKSVDLLSHNPPHCLSAQKCLTAPVHELHNDAFMKLHGEKLNIGNPYKL